MAVLVFLARSAGTWCIPRQAHVRIGITARRTAAQHPEHRLCTRCRRPAVAFEAHCIENLIQAAGSRRQSLVFFHNPDYDAVIENLIAGQTAKYAPTTSGEHLRQMFTATQNG